jgi:hypothetical protein
LSGTIGSDPDFLKFCSDICDVVAPKKPSAEAQLDLLLQKAGLTSTPTPVNRLDILNNNISKMLMSRSAASAGAKDAGKDLQPGYIALTQKHDPKKSALLQFMKQEGERRMAERRAARGAKGAKGERASEARNGRDAPRDGKKDKGKVQGKGQGQTGDKNKDLGRDGKKDGAGRGGGAKGTEPRSSDARNQSAAGSSGKGGNQSAAGSGGKGGSQSAAGSGGKGGSQSAAGSSGKGGSQSAAGSGGKGGNQSAAGSGGKGGANASTTSGGGGKGGGGKSGTRAPKGDGKADASSKPTVILRRRDPPAGAGQQPKAAAHFLGQKQDSAGAKNDAAV